ncbi:MAG: TMEM164 family acyltransferase, partial [Brachybacterium sp.]
MPEIGTSRHVLAEEHVLAEGHVLAKGHLVAEGALGHMPAYGAAHVSMLVLLVMAAVVLVRWARRGEPERVDRVLRIAGWVLLANAVFWTAWGFMPWAWNLEES